MKVSELIASVLALYKDPKKWAQGYYAFDAKGWHTRPRSPEATCFCTMGAFRKCSPSSLGTYDFPLVAAAEATLGKVLGDGWGIWAWNDKPGRTLPQIRSGLRKAYALALDEEAQAV